MHLNGLHHVTAVSSHASANHAFYTGVLGMRLVKKTVNQDDVSAYHLFYADAQATPGTDLTFFDWRVPRARPGTRSVTRTALRVSGEASLRFWADRFQQLQVWHGQVHEQDGRWTLDFEDPEGQRLRLVDDGGVGDAFPWHRSPVPAEMQIRGLGPVTLSVLELSDTDRVLTEALQLRPVRTYTAADEGEHLVHVYEMGAGGVSAELHVAVQPGRMVARPGAGGVHHVAFRTPNDDQYHAWTEHLRALGIQTSGEIDRYYFRSLYFREPGGVLFEIATDGPGFTTDEPLETLGERLALPPFLEAQRAQIEAQLRPL